MGAFARRLLTAGDYDFFGAQLPTFTPVAMEYRMSVHLAKHRDMAVRAEKNVRKRREWFDHPHEVRYKG